MRARAALVLVLAGLAACSGSGRRLTAAGLTREANAVCHDADADVNASFAALPSGREPKPEEIQAVIAKLVPVVAKVADDLDGLRPPRSLDARYTLAIAELRAGNAKVAKAGKSTELAATIFATDHDPYDKANAIFEGLGMADCGGGGGSTTPRGGSAG